MDEGPLTRVKPIDVIQKVHSLPLRVNPIDVVRDTEGPLATAKGPTGSETHWTAPKRSTALLRLPALAVAVGRP